MTQPASDDLDSRMMNWSDIARRLVAWHAEHQRVLPWRDTPPGARDPYAVWVSEIMAQQTRLEVVVDYFQRWMARFPKVHALAAADQQDVLKQWRARNDRGAWNPPGRSQPRA